MPNNKCHKVRHFWFQELLCSHPAIAKALLGVDRQSWMALAQESLAPQGSSQAFVEHAHQVDQRHKPGITVLPKPMEIWQGQMKISHDQPI